MNTVLPYLPVGKLDPDILQRLLRAYGSQEERLVVGPKVGEDAAVIDMGDRYLVVTTDPITFATDEIGWYAVHVNANDIATMGARPLWFFATLLLPEGQTTEPLAASLFAQISSACRGIGVSLCGGHTEVTAGLDRVIVVGHMLGEVERSGLVTSSGARVGDEVILTKGIAIEATSVLAREKGNELEKSFSRNFLARCRELLHEPGISVVRDAGVARGSATVHAMHDPTEGGLAMGLHEICQASQVGMLVTMENIPVLPETVRLCRHLGLDPLGSIASGALLICAVPADSLRIINALQAAGIQAKVIGEVTERQKGVHISAGGKARQLPRFERDEVARVFGSG